MIRSEASKKLKNPIYEERSETKWKWGIYFINFLRYSPANIEKYWINCMQLVAYGA
jgi:hypothetical protein